MTIMGFMFNSECQALRQWESEALSKQSDFIATDRLTFLTGVGSGQRLRYRILPATEWEDLSLVEAVFCLMKLRHRKLLKMRDTNTMDEFRNKLMDICGLSDRNGNESSSSSVFSSECSGESSGESSNDEQKSDSAAMASAFHRLFGLNIRVHPGNEMYNYKLLTFGDCNNGNDSVDIGHVYGTLYVPLDGALAPDSVEAELRNPPLNRLVERIAAEIQTNRQLSQSHRNSNSNSDEVDPEVAAAALAAARASELNRILNLFEGVQQYDESCEPPAVSVNADFKRRLDDDPTRYRLCTVECVKNRSGQRFGVPVNRQDDGLNQIQLKNPGSWFPGEQVVVELLDQVQPNGASKGRVLGYYKRQLRYNFLGHQQLQELLAEQPDRFKICTLELNGVQGGSAVPVDPSDPIARIEINGRENCGRACANDQVVVEIMERKGADPANKEVKGRVVGMHQQAEKLRYQLFLCEVLSNVGALMRPLCGTFPKIAYDNSIAQKALKEMPDNGFDGHEERSGTGQQQVTQNRDHVLSIDRDFVSVFSPRKDSKGKIYFEHDRCQRVNKEFCEQTFLVCFEYWHLDKNYPMGKVVYVLENTDGSLAEAFGLIQMRHRLPRPLRDSKELRNQVANVQQKANSMGLRGRLDMRKVLTVTIDNPDTRDMDDAISYERCYSTGVETVGVHITDICEFIGRKGSPLDRVARGRLRTIYPPKVGKSLQQVTPNHMLPKTLAEDVLSLGEGSDRFCLSVLFKFKRDKKSSANLLWEHPEFHQTVVRSDLRLNKIDVQPVLLETERSADSFGDRLTPDFVSMLRSLWDIARCLRLKRLGEAGFQLQDDDFCDDDDEQGAIGRTFETSCLIEELMVLANLSVGQWLAEQQRPVVARVQDEPRPAEVQNWLGKFGPTLVHMPRLQRDLRGLRVSFSLCKFPLSLSRADYDFIMKYQIGRPRDCVLRLMHDSRHPHMMLALSEWFSITQPAQYAPTADENPAEEARRKVYHFSLQQANYVHFTSPMRRYPDIVVHRAFRAAINNQQQGPATGETSESLSDLCDSLRTLERRVKMFEKDSMSYAYASRLKRRPQQELVVLRSIDDGEMSFTSSRLRRMPKILGVVKMSSFGLNARPEPRGLGKFRCKWSRRIFVHSSCEDSSRYNTPVLHYIGSEVRVKRDVYVQRVNCDPVVKLRKDFISSGANYESVRGQFRQLQDVVLEDQGAWMITCENDQLAVGANEQLLVSGKPVQFYREFAVGDIMRLQFRAQLRQGLLTPSVALIEVCGSHTVCVTHKDDPVRCFAEVTDVKSKPSYRDIDEYATIWQRIVAIESATIAASTDDSVILHEVALDWSYHQPTERWLGAFHLPEDFRIKYQLKFGTDASAHDPMIDEKLNDLEGQHGRGGGDSLSKVAVNEAFELAGERDRYSEFLCVRFPGDSSKAASSQDYFTAVAHGGILLAYRTVHGRCRNCNFKRDEDFSYDCQIVVFSLQQHDLCQRFDWSSVSTATVEVMQKFLPIRRQELALWRLPAMSSTSLAHKIALLGSREARISDASYGEKLHQKGVKSYSIETGSEERFNEHTGRTYIMRKRIPCNQAQTDAITDAMKYDLTLIWGPPGTGKTSTGVMLTYWYVFVNRCFDEGLLDADQSDNQDDDDDLNGNVIEDSSAEAVSINYSEFRKEGDPDGSNGSAEGGDDGEWEGLAEALRLSLEDAAEWNHVGTRGRVSRRSTQSSDSFAALFQKSSSTPLRPKRYNKQMKTDDKELQTRRQVLYCGPSNRSVDVVAEYLKKKLDTKCPAIVRVYSDQLEQKKYPVPGDGLNRKNNSEFGDGDIDPMMREIALHELIRQQQRNPISWIILLGFDELFKRFLAENQHTQRAWVRSLILTAKSNSSFHSYLERLVFELPSKKRRLEQKVMNYTDLPIGSLITAYRNVLSAAKQRVLQQFEVILCTTSVSCSSVLQSACKFSQIIIDEAGMCTEPETLVPLVDCSFSSTAAGASGIAKRASHSAERLVLIGDHKQLRPIIQNRTAEQLGLGVSLFERHSHRAIMLSYQYRMHPSLCEFSADYFYRTSSAHLQTRQSPSWTGLQVDDVEEPKREWNGINTHHLARYYVFDSYNFRTEGRASGKLRLENSNVLIGCWPGVRRLTDYPPDGSCHVYSSHRVVQPTDLHVKGEEDRIVFLHVEGVEEKTTVSTEEGSEDSRRNIAEIDEVVRIYKEIRRRCERPRLASESVAVLSQYKYQVISIIEKLRGEGIKSPVVKTVNESQGSEFDYVILSLVRSLPNYEIPKSPIPSWEHKYLGFITDANQINVALTRARRGLIIIGNRFLLQANPMWSSLLSSLRQAGRLSR
ncbi:hypothetical protein BOX15_Mlig003274g1 [Macrostomum lignano]|uniref:RNB domain-containing protein n=2 Tax=Macrostomum lignano TaxID=282301 RepID=A0A267ENG6_9PLAT|nr:hypothetical protein BOX15_Mlig003274g1 [Macrostomum lignano]